MNPKVSIILPTYNGGKYIKRAVESVLSQIFSDWELIVIDDESTDNTEEIIKDFINKDNRIKYLYQDNAGPGQARKNGIIHSKGEYIAFIDDDDIWNNNNKLNKQVEFLDNNQDYVLVGSNGIVVDENNNKIMNYFVPEKDVDIKKNILIKNPFIQCSILIRKSILSKIEEFPVPGRKCAQDYELFLKMNIYGKSLNLKDQMVSYTFREGNISSGYKVDILKNNILLIKEFKNKYPNYYKALILSHLKYLIYVVISNIILNKRIKNTIFSFLFRVYRKINFLD